MGKPAPKPVAYRYFERKHGKQVTGVARVAENDKVTLSIYRRDPEWVEVRRDRYLEAREEMWRVFP